MTLKILISPRQPLVKFSSVSINPVANNRVTFNKVAIMLLKENSNVDFLSHVQVFIDFEKPNCFWFRCCGSDAEESKKIHGKYSYTISCNSLVKYLKIENRIRCKLTWDTENVALKGEV